MKAERARTARPPSRQERHRVLIVTDTSCIERGRCAQLSAWFGAPVEALVVAPAHEPNRWVVDEGAVLSEATRRLETCAECLAESGIAPEKRIGDPDAVQAIADALAGFPADEVLVVAPPARHSWGRKSVIDRARAAFRVPIEHVVVPSRRAGRVRNGGGATR